MNSVSVIKAQARLHIFDLDCSIDRIHQPADLAGGTVGEGLGGGFIREWRGITFSMAYYEGDNLLQILPHQSPGKTGLEGARSI